MVTEDILIKFFVIIMLLFFLPKVIYRFSKIPYPITEVLLGIILGIAIPTFFFIDDMLNILSTLGIITLFVYSGMEIDTKFIITKKRVFIENILIHLAIFIIAGIVISKYFVSSVQVAFLIALALLTPSASYILSVIKNTEKECKQWIESKAITGEITGIALLIILLGLSDIKLLFISIVTLVLLITVLPLALEFLYKKIFCKIIGIEFSFIFVVAMLSAFITEFIGVHFLVGAFIAGVVSRQFIRDLVRDQQYKHISDQVGQQLIEGFGFFALIFTPFYFFTIGLKINSSLFTIETLGIASLVCISIILVRITTTTLHRTYRIKENPLVALKISIMITPTLVFTFVIAELLKTEFGIDTLLFSILMLYAVFTAIISTVLFLLPFPSKNRIIDFFRGNKQSINEEENNI